VRGHTTRALTLVDIADDPIRCGWIVAQGVTAARVEAAMAARSVTALADQCGVTVQDIKALALRWGIRS
jgi:hypothetical protein